MGSWRRLPCSITEVNLDYVLAGGQSFRWSKASNTWEGVIGNQVWRLQQQEDAIDYQVYENEECTQSSGTSTYPSKLDMTPSANAKSVEKILTDYFALEIALNPLYSSWAEADQRFAVLAPRFPGIRILRQDFLETLFTFICSSNNNINRIQQMIEKICLKYGAFICELNGRRYHAFPRIESLASQSVEAELRELGFGYRAAFIQKSAQYIVENTEWLGKVEKADYRQSKAMLMELAGVGAKGCVPWAIYAKQTFHRKKNV